MFCPWLSWHCKDLPSMDEEYWPGIALCISLWALSQMITLDICGWTKRERSWWDWKWQVLEIEAGVAHPSRSGDLTLLEQEVIKVLTCGAVGTWASNSNVCIKLWRSWEMDTKLSECPTTRQRALIDSRKWKIWSSFFIEGTKDICSLTGQFFLYCKSSPWAKDGLMKLV